MKIYFAGSISAGRGNQEVYALIINILKKYGTVLTEHIADKNLTDLGEVTESITDKYIFDRDVSWLKESDVVVAEVTTPSLGVGYEIGLAESISKSVVCLFQKTEGKKLSAMLLGNSSLKVYTYDKPDELFNILDEHFNKHL